MRATYRLLFVILFYFQGVLGLYSQSNPITLNPIPVVDQFPSKSVQRILQDSEGFLWFGTDDGVCRYDGYRVLVFRSDFNNPDILPNNKITCLAEDTENHIWIGTREGLCILDKETFRIKPFTAMPNFNQNVQALLGDSKGNIWIGMEGRIFRHDPQNSVTEELKDIVPGGGINYIYEDHSGKIWILTWGGGIYEYKKDGTIVRYPPVGQKNVPFRIFQDSKDRYWVCTWADGVYQFDPNHKEAMYKKYSVSNLDRGTEENIFFSIAQDEANGYIWLVSFSGIYALQYGEDDTVSQVDVSYLFKEINNIFSEIIKDREGNLWIAAYDEGAYSINFNKPMIYNLPLQDIHHKAGVIPNITALYKDTDSILWLNQNRTGLLLYDIKTDKAKTYEEIPAFRDISFMGNISCFENAGEHELWLGATNEGKIGIVGKMKGEPYLKRIIDLKTIAPEIGVKKLFRDSKQNIWIICMRHIFFKPAGSEEITVFPENLNNITGITEDTDGYIWMSSSTNGLYRISPGFSSDTEVKTDNYNKETCELISNNVLTVCCDHNRNIWFGLKDGSIIGGNTRELTFKDYTQEFNMNGETIQDILADNKDNILVSTNKRVIVYNKKVGSSRDYSVDDDLIVNSFRTGACFSDTKNEMFYFGGNKGICVFLSPAFTTQKSAGTKVTVSDVKLNGQSLLSTLNNSKFGIVSQKLSLSPGDRNIELDFTALNYTYPGKIRYAYKMEGIDKDWIYTNRQFATYNQLKKGNHVFQVKATDENRIWHNDITTFHIYKAPAFYETWWAYIIYMLIAVLISYWIYRVIKNRIQLQQELRIAQIEKDKSEELIQVKLKYFTNISHDLLTPLTVISCLIDDLETLIKPKVRQFALMRASVNRLRRLLQQVLDFRKMESGNMKLRVSNGDIAVFIKDIYANNFMPLFERKGIRFLFKSEPSSIFGYFDADKVDKIVYNLLSNALKYTPEGGTVEVGLEETQKGKTVSISVSDTGIGIPPEHLNDIFVRFYNNKHINSGQTNGIGLSLTRELAELHHGSISVESKLGEGSAFKVVIPIGKTSYSENEIDNCLLHISRSSDDYSEKNDDTELVEVEEGILQKENVNILLVEDNPDILQTVKNILDKRYNILTATDGLIALEIVKEKDVDLIISDVMMPRMDGLELCKTIKTDINTSHIPVLLLTAKSSVEDRIDCYDAGADGYISKPFDIKLLVARINNFLKNKKNKQSEFKANAEINISILEYASLDETFLTRAVELIEEHLSDSEFDIEAFTSAMNMSKSTLYRKIKTMTDLSPNDFIRNIRLKHACQMLKNQSVPISEVAYATGFSEQRYFAKCFKAEFGMTPTEYRKSQA